MIIGSIKNKVDSIWTDLWASGTTNPLTVIEQLTYLIFIRSLDEIELRNEKLEQSFKKPRPRIFPQTEAGQSMRWSKFKNMDPRQISDIVSNRVFPAVKNMRYGQLPDFDQTGKMIEIPARPGDDDPTTSFARYMQDASFAIQSEQTLQKIVTKLDDLFENDIKEDRDMQGDLYEYMLSKISTSGTNGQFRTPKHIRDMMVKLVDPDPDDFICDPACGTAGFLISAAEHIREKYEETMTREQWNHYDSTMFTGFETDKTMLRISTMNLMLHSITRPEIVYLDSVSKNNTGKDRYTVCLANPPFKGNVEVENINEDLKAITDTKKTELLFVALFTRILRKGGRCACIVPDGVLFGSSKAHLSLRKNLVERQMLQAVISMPSGVFKPYAGVSTAVLVFTRTDAGGTEDVWFYDMKSDGYSLDDKRLPLDSSDIPDIVERFHNLEEEKARERTDQSFLVPKDEIVSNGYDLSINKYKKVVYEEKTYPPSKDILKEIKGLTRELMENPDELEKMV